jgi:hypothetical protein
VREFDIGIILFAIHNIPDEERRSVLEICKSTPAKVVFAPDLLETLRRATIGSAGAHASGSNGAAAVQTVAMPHAASREIPTQPLKPNGWRESPGVDLPASQVGAWLEELEQRLEDGDLAAARQYLHDLRSSLPVDRVWAPAVEQPEAIEVHE